MKKPFHQSKLSLILILICVSFALTQCKWVMVHGTRGYHGSNSVTPDTDHHYDLYLCSTIYKDGLGTRPVSYRDSKFEAEIKSAKILHGKELENKITIPKWKKWSCHIEKTCWSKDK